MPNIILRKQISWVVLGTYLVNGVHLLFDDGRRDDFVDVLNGFQDALAVPFGLVQVAKLECLVDS